ncbi:hypothetical protein OG453_44085 [Streptomyces sp. NBC_01381]|uniref:hypothetical protein n=1 Tax=Streptomyces sp. NBC_01381 TaxID=2903845 RepID=UPI002258695E|nr:hypothetical protein [Streptomyces sp. NBC_01381]MCX4673540.1 hypothetical protein [Streptomyces sp. NBC_01381]
MTATRKKLGDRTGIDAVPSTAAAPLPFDMPQAFVLVAFLAAAVVLTLTAHMDVNDILILLGGAGGIGAVVLFSAHMKQKGPRAGAGVFRRIITAVLNQGTTGIGGGN